MVSVVSVGSDRAVAASSAGACPWLQTEQFGCASGDKVPELGTNAQTEHKFTLDRKAHSKLRCRVLRLHIVVLSDVLIFYLSVTVVQSLAAARKCSRFPDPVFEESH